MTRVNPEIEYLDPYGNVIAFSEFGQIGQYQDSRWIGKVTIHQEGLNHEDMVRYIIESRVREGHIFSMGVRRPFAAPYFTHFRQDTLNPKEWRFTVVRDFLD